MIITATQKYVRQTPRKVRLVASSVRKMKLETAIRQLGVMDRTASTTVLKVVRQALANAMNNHSIKFEELQLKNIIVNEGATYKRFRAVSRGRAHNIMKKSCHITVELEKPDVSPVIETKKVESTKKTTIKYAKGFDIVEENGFKKLIIKTAYKGSNEIYEYKIYNISLNYHKNHIVPIPS